MKRAISIAVLAGVMAVGLFGSTEAKADHRRSRVGVFVGPGGFSVGVGYGGPRRFYGGYPYRGVPVVRHDCCHYERVFVPGRWDRFGHWHPGYFQTYRDCDHHGRVIAY
jgi:hypothetical protein